MDTMRSLNTSLPRASPPKQQEPPEQLLAAFKAAALSVTNLYKSAASDQGRTRSEGYQDALDELLAFLDKENIGLSDGEGWRIRRWATERLDGRDTVSQNNDSDDEVDKTERGSSPALQRSNSATRVPLHTSNTARNASPPRTETPPATIITPNIDETAAHQHIPPPQTTFTFRSQHSYPQDTDIILADPESDDSRTLNNDTPGTLHASTTHNSSLAVPRIPRTKNGYPGRLNAKTTSSIGRGAGQKRKINFGDFFDIGNVGHGKESSGGGGKRGRFV